MLYFSPTIRTYLGLSDFQSKMMSSFHSIFAEDLKAEREDGSSALLLLLLNYLHTLAFTKCSTGKVDVFSLA